MRIPRATYRLQFTPRFGFAMAAGAMEYLSRLGVSDIYASPIFKARRGSVHGYDVVDPRALNPELGTPGDFSALIGSAHAAGLRWLQDIVPNHMAIDGENPMLMDVLESGEQSPYFRYFDVDWDHPYESIRGRMLLPVLGSFYADALESGQIRLTYDADGFHICYYGFRLPLRAESYPAVMERNIREFEQNYGTLDVDVAKFLGVASFFKAAGAQGGAAAYHDAIRHAKQMLWELYCASERVRGFVDGTVQALNGSPGNPASFNDLDALITAQRYKLSFWKTAAEEINYRRFFTINDLVSVRVQDEDVFNAAHGYAFELADSGLIDGLRIDHIDGLNDPGAYLARLRQRLPGAYIVVEKILARGETLPQDWPVQGTTGYDSLNAINGVLCDREHEQEFSKLYYRFTRMLTPFEELVSQKKRLIIDTHLAGNVDNLARQMKAVAGADRHGRDITLHGLRRALSETMVNYPVYRTYIGRESSRAGDEAYIAQAIERSRRSIPGYGYELGFIESFLQRRFSDVMSEEQKGQWVDFVMSFQQFTAPLMAKGCEDTLLYVYNKLISLNEVGGNPNVFGCPLEEFHAFNAARAHASPYSLTATSTHDTKRGEDARSRITALSEMPREWESQIKLYRRLNRGKKQYPGGRVMPDANDEYFIYQTLIGTFVPEADKNEYAARIGEYIIKAVREANVHTAWVEPDAEYEAACMAFIRAVLDDAPDNAFLKVFIPFQRRVSHFGLLNSLTQVLVKATLPGVPDFYQGSELWDFNLVDPDNRRPVDFQERAQLLAGIVLKEKEDVTALIAELLRDTADGRIKLFLIYRLLAARKADESLFIDGEYLPLAVRGERAENVIAYCRRLSGRWCIVAAGRLFSRFVKEGAFPCDGAGWGSTTVVFPDGAPRRWRNAVTGRELEAGAEVPVCALFDGFPGAVLINAQEEA